MSHRSLAAVLAAIAVAVLAPAVAAAQSAETAVPRTAWGAPDMSGVWDFRSITPMERPGRFGRQGVSDGGRGGEPRAGNR